MPAWIAVLLICSTAQQAEIRVESVQELRRALSTAKPGTKVLIEPGDYPGGLHFSNLHGAPGKPIVIAGADPADPPKFMGGGSGLQFSNVSHLELRNLKIERATGNGLNIDDGGRLEKPTHHVTLRSIHVSDLPPGNRDGIKLSGVDDFRVEGCTVERWGGSAIDMVGCHRGTILDCTFRTGGDSAVQTKGGSSEVTIRKSRFENYGQRGVNIGGSTGLQFFRPPISKMPENGKYEAKRIVVEGCTFIGGTAPFAFVGVDGATVRFNTILHPERWAIRILQETREPGFVPCRAGVFEDNLVVFKSTNWFEGGVNIGSGTAPESFRFARNFWFCSDRPERSTPHLPSAEADGLYGKDPMLDERLKPKEGSPAMKVGAHALPGEDLSALKTPAKVWWRIVQAIRTL